MKFKSFALIVGTLIISSCLPKKHNTSNNKGSEGSESKSEFPYRSTYTRAFDLIHTDLEVAFEWDKQHLIGRATLDLKPYFYVTDSLILDAKGLEVSKINLIKNDQGERKKLPFKNDSLHLRIGLGREYTRNDTLKIEVLYTSKPNEIKNTESTAIRESKGLYFVNPLGKNKHAPLQIWTQGEPESNSCWFPTIDAPNERCTQNLRIVIDDQFKTLSNGNLIQSVKNEDGTRMDHWEQKLPHAPYLFMMAIGKFDIVQEEWRGKKVQYLVSEGRAEDAKATFANTVEMLEFFSQKLGLDYPWDKYSQVVVKDFVSGAMENTSATVHNNIVLKSKRELIDGSREDIIAHELVHQWFGDLVTCESWSNLSLNESFASYGEYLWNEYKYGKWHADRYWYNDFRRYLREQPKTPIINFHYEFKEDMFNRHSYEKGSTVLHQLRKSLGDEAFFVGLTHFLKTKAYKSAEIEDLRMAFEEVSGLDLNPYFNQWFKSNGHPVVRLRFKQLSDSLIVKVTQVQQDKSWPLYDFELDLKLYNAVGEVEKKTVRINDYKEEFLIMTEEDVQWVGPNYEHALCAEFDLDFEAEQALMVFKQSKNYVEKRKALEFSSADTTIAGWELRNLALKDSCEPFRRLAISYIANSADSTSEEFQIQLKTKAIKDESSEVRADAIRYLSKRFASDSSLIPLYKGKLADSSYKVNIAAIIALHKIKREDALLRAIQMEGSSNIGVLKTLCKLYEDLDDESKISFYTKSAQKTEGHHRTAVLSSFEKYLKDKSHEFVWKGLKKIKIIAQYANDRKARKKAGLVIHELHKGHKTRIEDIERDIKDKKGSSKGSSYDLKMLEEKHIELLEKELKIQQLINEVISSEIDQNVLDYWSTNGFVLEELITVPESKKPIGTETK